MIDLFSRWIHILAAITLVGGTIFMRFSLIPSLSSLDEESRAQLQSAVRARWAKLVMLTSGLLLLTGLYNVVSISKTYEFQGPVSYHMLIGVKLLLALVVFWISAVLSGRSEMADRFRQKQEFWQTINIIVAVVLICVAGYMKMIDRAPKASESAVQVSMPEQRTFDFGSKV